jgi:hypothetical protein
VPEPREAPRALERTDATRMLEDTAVTTPLARTQAAPRRRRMEPIAEPPRAPAPPRRAAAQAPARAAARRRPGGLLRTLRTLLIVLLLAAVAIGTYVLVTESGQRGVRLKEQVQGDVDQAVDEIQDLIGDNTR